MFDSSSHRVSLVTGGAGFIGSHLVEQLVARGDRVVVIDDLSTGSLDNLRHVDSDRLHLHHTTVTQGLQAYQPGDFAEIYHLAAAVGVRLVIAQPVHTIETNIHETSAVLKFAAMSGTPTFIASTSEVYGKSEKTPFREDDDVIYGPTTLSRWSYAYSKAIDEHLALAYHREGSMPVSIVRFFNTVGPRQVGHYGMVVPRFVEAALAGRPIPVYGDGTQTRCFCDVRDVVTVLPSILSSDTCRGRIFNMGRDDSISIMDLARIVKSTLDSDSDIELVPYDRAFGPGFDDLQDRAPDLSAIRAAVGFTPQISLEQTILDIATEMKSSAGSSSLERTR